MTDSNLLDHLLVQREGSRQHTNLPPGFASWLLVQRDLRKILELFLVLHHIPSSWKIIMNGGNKTNSVFKKFFLGKWVGEGVGGKLNGPHHRSLRTRLCSRLGLISILRSPLLSSGTLDETPISLNLSLLLRKVDINENYLIPRTVVRRYKQNCASADEVRAQVRGLPKRHPSQRTTPLLPENCVCRSTHVYDFPEPVWP